MRTLGAKDPKYGFGRLINLAGAAPVTVAKYGEHRLDHGIASSTEPRSPAAARPVLPVLFRFVPGLRPELVFFGPHSLQIHGLDIFRVYAAERLDLMDDLIRYRAPGLVTQPLPDPPASHGNEHRERHEQISGHRS